MISGNVHYIRLRKKAYKAEVTLALKLRGDITRSPKHRYQWPPKKAKKDICPPKT